MSKYVTMISADPRRYPVDSAFPYDKMPQRLTKAATTPSEAAYIVAVYAENDEVITVYDLDDVLGDVVAAYKKSPTGLEEITRDTP